MSSSVSRPDRSAIYDNDSGRVQVTVSSFGYRWRTAPEATIIVDLRNLLPDLNRNADLRGLTGVDSAARDYVLRSPGAHDILVGTAQLTARALNLLDPRNLLVKVAFGSAAGRLRSVVLANALLHELQRAGIGADLDHMDILRPPALPGR